MRRGREEVRGVREMRERVEGVLGGLGDVGLEEVEGVEGKEGQVKGTEAAGRERKKREEMVVWDVINRTVP